MIRQFWAMALVASAFTEGALFDTKSDEPMVGAEEIASGTGLRPRVSSARAGYALASTSDGHEMRTSYNIVVGFEGDRAYDSEISAYLAYVDGDRVYCEVYALKERGFYFSKASSYGSSLPDFNPRSSRMSTDSLVGYDRRSSFEVFPVSDDGRAKRIESRFRSSAYLTSETVVSSSRVTFDAVNDNWYSDDISKYAGGFTRDYLLGVHYKPSSSASSVDGANSIVRVTFMEDPDYDSAMPPLATGLTLASFVAMLTLISF